MANEESIDNLLSPKAFKQLEKLDEQLIKSQARLIDCAEAAAMLNNSLASSKTAKEFSDSQKKMAIENEKLRQQIAKTDAEQLKVAALKQKAIDKEVAARTKEQAALNKKAAAEAKANKETLAAAGSVDQLRAKLGRLTAAYNALSKSERENADIGGVQLKNIQELDSEIKGIAESTGNFRDSVGNYAKGLSGPLGGVVSGFEAIGGAMLALPLAIVAAGLYGIYKALLLNDDAATRLQGAFLGLETITSNAANSFVDFLNRVKENETAGDVLEVIGDGLLKIIPGAELATFAVNKFLEANKDVIDVATQYALGMDAIEFSTNKSTVAISENELAMQRLETASKDVTKSGKERLAALDQQSKLESQNAAVSIALTDQKLFLENKLLKVQKAGSTQAEETEFRIFELQKERNDRLREQEELQTTQARRRASLAREIAAEEKKIIDDQFNLEKQRLEFQRDAQKRVADDTSQSLEARLAAESAYYDKQAALLSLSLNHDLKEVDLSATKRKQIQEKYANDSALLEAERVKNVNKIAVDSYRQAEAEFDKYLTRQQKERLQAQKNELLSIETARDRELAAVTGSTEEDANKRLEIEKKYTLQYIDLQIQQAQAAIESAKIRGLAVNEEEAKLAALQRKRTEAGIKTDKEANKTKLEQFKEYASTISSITQGIFDLIGALSQRLYQNQINDINAAQKTSDKRYDRERQNIENSTATESEKKVKLAILDKKKAAQDQQLEERKKKAELEAARRDRAIKIAQIIANTAIAVLTQLSIPGAGFGLAAAAAAVGALQLATVLATPLPAYEHGGIHPKDGPALFSEKGEELRIDPDGTVSLTPPTPTVGFVKAGTEFKSNKDLKKMIAMNTLGDYIQGASNVNFDVNKLTSNANSNTDRLIRAQSRKQPIRHDYNGMVVYKTQA